MPGTQPPATLILIPGLLLTGKMWSRQSQHSLAAVDNPLAVCGLSMGGYIALEICTALRNASNVDGLGALRGDRKARRTDSIEHTHEARPGENRDQ